LENGTPSGATKRILIFIPVEERLNVLNERACVKADARFLIRRYGRYAP
jgi:hypothetical protein